MLFDTHCHISDEGFDDSRDALIEEIRASELKYIMDVGTDLATSRRVVQTPRSLDFCYAIIGCFPSDTYSFDEEQLAQIKALAADPRVRAIGEIGLDYHYDNTDKKTQQHWFARQIETALELRLPIAIHSREADQDTMDILKHCGAFSRERAGCFPLHPDGRPDARVLLHCFSGSAELGRQYTELGATLSICGPVTYKNARKTVEVVEQTDIRRLVTETDSPYLTPVPFRGRQNKPVYVEYTARKIAEIKGISYEEVCRITFENACRFFGIENER